MSERRLAVAVAATNLDAVHYDYTPHSDEKSCIYCGARRSVRHWNDCVVGKFEHALKGIMS